MESVVMSKELKIIKKKSLKFEVGGGIRGRC